MGVGATSCAIPQTPGFGRLCSTYRSTSRSASQPAGLLATVPIQISLCPQPTRRPTLAAADVVAGVDERGPRASPSFWLAKVKAFFKGNFCGLAGHWIGPDSAWDLPLRRDTLLLRLVGVGTEAHRASYLPRVRLRRSRGAWGFSLIPASKAHLPHPSPIRWLHPTKARSPRHKQRSPPACEHNYNIAAAHALPRVRFRRPRSPPSPPLSCLRPRALQAHELHPNPCGAHQCPLL